MDPQDVLPHKLHTILVDTSACTCGDKSGLLQRSSVGYFRTTVTMAAVCLQRRCSSRVLHKVVGANNCTSLWTTLAEISRENSVLLVMCSRVSLPYRHGTVIPCWDLPLNCRHSFTSASTSMLVIPSTQRTTLGDPAFLVTAAWAWNALLSVRSAPSLLQFRRYLKMALLLSSHTSP